MVQWPEVTAEWRGNAKPKIIFKSNPIVIAGTMTTTTQHQQKQEHHKNVTFRDDKACRARAKVDTACLVATACF